MVPRKLISSNIHHSTNTTNMWQGQKSFFVWKMSLHLVHRWLTYDEAQVAGDRAQAMGSMPRSVCEVQDFWIPIMLPPRHLLWCLSKSWPTDEGLAAGTVMNLWMEANFAPKPTILWHPENPPSLWAGTICSHGNRQKGTSSMSSACWIWFSFVHWVSTGAGSVRFQSIAQSHNHYDG